MNILQKPSPNFDTRRNDQKPSLLILHYTGMQSGAQALERLCDSESKVSAHYTVDEDGTIYEHVEEDKRAWHAGASYWRGEPDINSASIGIELVNPGHEFGYRAFPEKQISNLTALCKIIIKRYGIVAKGVLAHSDVAPARKQDPGELFPWKDLAGHGIGVWPESPSPTTLSVSDETQASLPSPFREREGTRRSPKGEDGEGEGLKSMLIQYGYDPECHDTALITAFQRHFVPEAFENGVPGEADSLTKRRLHSLIQL